MLFLFILGNFNKSTKPRLPECRAVLSGREPRALPQLRMTSMSHQVAGTIWMLDSLLVTPFGNVIVLHYAWHRSYTIHNAAAGAREPVLRSRGAPRAQHSLSKNRICWWRHPPPPPSDLPSKPHEADREAPSPDLWWSLPCTHCHASPQRHQYWFQWAPFLGEADTLAFHAG